MQKIKLFGIIDRVDLKDGKYRIVDYKTGSDKLRYNTIEECFDTDCGNINKALVQTLFYTYVYEQASKSLTHLRKNWLSYSITTCHSGQARSRVIMFIQFIQHFLVVTSLS
ncbi:MAG: hypothetical protein EOO89_22920 [Pedobacter sp.]|nr:MAG: hypothetical protein EOO89_22920 [Pedobacter sp.]